MDNALKYILLENNNFKPHSFVFVSIYSFLIEKQCWYLSAGRFYEGTNYSLTSGVSFCSVAKREDACRLNIRFADLGRTTAQPALHFASPEISCLEANTPFIQIQLLLQGDGCCLPVNYVPLTLLLWFAVLQLPVGETVYSQYSIVTCQ